MFRGLAKRLRAGAAKLSMRVTKASCFETGEKSDGGDGKDWGCDTDSDMGNVKDIEVTVNRRMLPQNKY